MCAAKSSTPLNQNPSSNSNSQRKTRPTTGGTFASRDQNLGQETRNAKPSRSREDKRKAWAKKARPVAKPSVHVAPSKAYASVCCSASATKPKAGAQEMAKDAETGKSKSQSKGLGHWRCSACGKATKVTVSKAVKEGTIETKTNA
jgi:hypothetical protein